MTEEEIEVIENKIMEIIDSKLKTMNHIEQYVLIEMLVDSLNQREREVENG